MSSKSLFKCKTGEAYQMKVLSELLTHNLKTGCFEIGPDGISLSMLDNPRKTMIDLHLEAENFSIYKNKSEEKMCIGLNMNHLYRMLKSIKKKDSLELFINSDNPTELGIKTIPKENTRTTTSSLKIQNIQNVNVSPPVGYKKPVIVPSSEFQKMCKDLSSIGSVNISVTASNFQIKFTADADGILTRAVAFGENDDSDDSGDESEPLYKATFATDQLSRIAKLSGLGTTMQIYTATPDLPILFRSSVGTLGKISVHIKSKELIDKENDDYETDDDE